MENKIIVSDLSEFISQLEKLVENLDHQNFEVFFRGHSDEAYLLVPSLLRNGSNAKSKQGRANSEVVKNEHIAFRSIVAKQSSEFFQCNSAIEYLVKMQHYRLKTRLLDITFNALIALYFACVNSDGKATDKKGEVIVFKLPKDIVKHYDSDTISALANIAKCKPSDFHFPLCGDVENPGAFVTNLGNDEKSQAYRRYTSLSMITHIENTKEEISTTRGGVPAEKRKEYIERLNPILDILSTLHASEKNISSIIEICKKDDFVNKRTSMKNLSDLINQIKQGNNLTSFISKQIQAIDTYSENRIPSGYRVWFNSNLGYLHHQIKAEKPYYTEQIEPYDLGKIWAVNTKLDNQRITNQSGAFFIFGLGISEVKDEKGVEQLTYTKEVYPIIPEDWIAGRITIGNQSENESSKGSIKAQKEKIVRDLGMLGIQRSFIFPDLENVAEEINNTILK